MADGWTVVPRRGPSKHRRRDGRHRGGGGGRPSASGSGSGSGGGGLYGASFDGAARRPPSAGALRDGETVGGERRDDADAADADRIRSDVLALLRALEGQARSGGGFASRLLSSVAAAASSPDAAGGPEGDRTAAGDGPPDDGDNDGDGGDDGPDLREIVAYGVGNFAAERAGAAALQLAGLLLLRRRAAARRRGSPGGGRPDDPPDDDVAAAFEREQGRVPVHYYEPCVLPVERKLLRETFRVHVLESNDMGKRTVESMRRERSATATDETETKAATTIAEGVHRSRPDDRRARATLFYMPHCPLRLYSNVLWAHWDRLFPLPPAAAAALPGGESDGGPVLVFGNSFRAYELRAISSSARSDPTNAVYAIASRVAEEGVVAERRGEIADDALRRLGTAFNDCAVVSFPDVARDGRGGSAGRPARPGEWTAAGDGDGELL